MKALVDVTIHMQIKIPEGEIANLEEAWPRLMANLNQYHKYVIRFQVGHIELIPDSVDPLHLSRDYEIVHLAPTPSPPASSDDEDLDDIHLL